MTWGTFLGLWYGRVLGSRGSSWMVEDDGPGVRVRPQQNETARQANLGGPSPQEGGIILLKYRQNWG